MAHVSLGGRAYRGHRNRWFALRIIARDQTFSAVKGTRVCLIAFSRRECWPWQTALLWLSCGQNFSPANHRAAFFNPAAGPLLEIIESLRPVGGGEPR
jgi:hypothetical protein